MLPFVRFGSWTAKCKLRLCAPTFIRYSEWDVFLSALSNVHCSIAPLNVTCDSSCVEESGNFAARSASKSGENANDNAARIVDIAETGRFFLPWAPVEKLLITPP